MLGRDLSEEALVCDQAAFYSFPLRGACGRADNLDSPDGREYTFAPPHRGRRQRGHARDSGKCGPGSED
eukprot:12674235-Alexandrium_andersonii.AAC.1